MKTTDKIEYAHDLIGTVLLAYDSWIFHKCQYKSSFTDGERQFHSGACRAYSVIVRHATGRRPQWFKDRDSLLECIHYNWKD